MDKAEIDAAGHGLQYSGKCLVQKCALVKGQANVYSLCMDAILDRQTQLAPKPGQFYLLRCARSNVEYNRPISVYHSEDRIDAKTGLKVVKLEFLILKKGRGTEELCTMLPGDEVHIIGPLGNTFEVPEGIKSEECSDEQNPEICILGGGIGVAPVANFASSLKAKSYDFFASFKTGSYGLDNVHAKNLTITTDDGTVGIHGMLPAAFTTDLVKQKGYKVIYACGPNAMLIYIQKVAREAGVKCFVSMENRMLCGVGACLGCTIPVVDGNRRVCKDGPIFDASIILFSPPSPRRECLAFGKIPDLRVNICGIEFMNPVIAASGTYGFGQNYRGLSEVNEIGGIVAKGVTLEPRLGNFGNRIIEVPSGNINSIGLQNPGIPKFIEEELPEMLKLKPVTIVNLAGSDLESYKKGAELLEKTDAPMIELNISCPNVRAGGMAWGIDPEQAKKCVSTVRSVTRKPLIVKLSPNAPDIVAVALACVEGGANALSLINTIQAMSIDIESGRPYFENIKAGLCGPAIRPIAVRMVYDVIAAINKLPMNMRVPVIGMGGIACWQDAVEFFMAGATAVQVGSAKFSNPNVMSEIITGLKQFMQSHGYRTIDDMRGMAQALIN